MKALRSKFSAIAITLCSAFLGDHAIAADETDAAYWLEKMNLALHEESYRGTFIYMRGKRFDTVEVTHHVEDDVEFERMTNVTGDEREILRTNDEAECFHAPGQHVSFNHEVPMGPFTHSFSKNLADNQSNYKISLHGKGRIAKRSTIKISISPLNTDRYGYRLWLDEESGLLLKSDLINQGRVLEIFQFTHLKIGEEIGQEISGEFQAGLPEFLSTSMAEVGTSHSLSRGEGNVEEQRPEWRVSWVPEGFKQVHSASANTLSFTDGVATVSVFVEPSIKSSLGNMQTSMGGTVVLTRQIKASSQQITVVGEVPIDTAKRVAESIEPIIY